MLIEELQKKAKFMREKILNASYLSGMSTHLGGSLSMVEIMAVLYGHILNFDNLNTRMDTRDRFILSKGHGVLGLFTALLVAKIIDEKVYETFLTNESHLIAHPVMNLDLGIESSNGSLGQGLSMGVGIALASKKKQRQNKVFVYMGDGECNEGSVWEAVMSAAQFKLDNLVAIVDYNKLQSDGDAREIMNLDDLAEKFRAFGWDSWNVDGHDIGELIEVFKMPIKSGKPKVLIAHTIKGKGISFMENNNEWHHNRLTKTNYELAMQELNSNKGMG